MKTYVKVFALILLFGLSFLQPAQAQANRDTVVIKTSAICGECKERIEKAVRFVKGTIESNVDLDTKEVTVVYKSDKTNPDELRKAIADAGYDADDVKADPKAFGKLPGCCQKPGGKHE
ncbi:MAG: heavy-metal-associated domain-containing protein [Flavobacteriales bacterium]|nr:heavy-metal-associated domain-containing protein [Flavobacteriales bacterium]MCB9447707.1 heavy-metal-associated domain-containing protein [Flavobacteriales bacterium]